MAKYLTIPTADGDSLANARIHNSTALTGLTNGTAYRAFLLSDPSEAFTPIADDSGSAGTTTASVDFTTKALDTLASSIALDFGGGNLIIPACSQAEAQTRTAGSPVTLKGSGTVSNSITVTVLDELPISEGCWVEADLYIASTGFGATYACYLAAGINMADATRTYLGAGLNANQSRVLSWTAGTAKNVSSTNHAAALTAGLHTLRAEFETGVQRLYLDGVLVQSTTEAAPSGAGDGVGVLLQTVGTWADAVGPQVQAMRCGKFG